MINLPASICFGHVQLLPQRATIRVEKGVDVALGLAMVQRSFKYDDYDLVVVVTGKLMIERYRRMNRMMMATSTRRLLTWSALELMSPYTINPNTSTGDGDLEEAFESSGRRMYVCSLREGLATSLRPWVRSEGDR